jgi:hypothetical protein
MAIAAWTWTAQLMCRQNTKPDMMILGHSMMGYCYARINNMAIIRTVYVNKRVSCCRNVKMFSLFGDFYRQDHLILCCWLNYYVTSSFRGPIITPFVTDNWKRPLGHEWEFTTAELMNNILYIVRTTAI